MGIGDFVDKAKRAVAGNEDKIAGAIDKAAGAVKGRTSESTDRRIDQASGKAREFLEKQKRQAGAPTPEASVPATPAPVRHPERTDPPAL
jgi:uncharacterized protein YjbJ (UPF0337 family)